MKEKWQKVDENKYSTYYVSSEGRCKKICKSTGEEVITLGGMNAKLHYYQFAGDYVHRHVAKAFVPNPDNKPHVDHINSNPFDNRAENLRWVTRKENNSTEHARMMRSANAWSTRHDGEIIIATNDDQKKLFKNGKECAKALGVSAPLIYNCLNNHGSACRAKGWKLSWISRKSKEAMPLVQVLEKEEEQRKIARQQKIDQERAARRVATKARHEERKRQKLEAKEKKRKEKLEARRIKQIAKLEARINIWKNHLDTTESRDKIQEKIRVLELQKKALSEKSI